MLMVAALMRYRISGVYRYAATRWTTIKHLRRSLPEIYLQGTISETLAHRPWRMVCMLMVAAFTRYLVGGAPHCAKVKRSMTKHWRHSLLEICSQRVIYATQVRHHRMRVYTWTVVVLMRYATSGDLRCATGKSLRTKCLVLSCLEILHRGTASAVQVLRHWLMVCVLTGLAATTYPVNGAFFCVTRSARTMHQQASLCRLVGNLPTHIFQLPCMYSNPLPPRTALHVIQLLQMLPIAMAGFARLSNIYRRDISQHRLGLGRLQDRL